MKIIQTLICFGLRHVAGEAAADTACKGIEFLVAHFTDDSQALPKAITAANDRTWKALAVALAGDGLLDQCKRMIGADQTTRNIRVQVEPFLRAAALDQLPKEFRDACLADLNKFRSSAEFKAGTLPAADFQQGLTSWQRYGDPRGVVEGASKAVNDVALALEKNYPKLSLLLRRRISGAPPLLASLFAFFLREEIAKNKELAAALTFDLLRNLFAAQEAAFAGVAQALDGIGDKLDALLGQGARIEAKVDENQALLLDMQAEALQQHGELHRLLLEVIARTKRHGIQGILSVRHSSIIHDDERDAVHALLRQFRQLPLAQQQQVPALLNGLGKLLVGAGEAKQATSLFVEAARIASGDAARAEIHYNAYRAAIEQRDWNAALAALRQATTFDAARFTFFPAHRYQVRRILGAGGFGTSFLCHDDHFGRLVVVKTLHEDLMDRSVLEAFNEARAASNLSNPAIIGIYDGDFADPVRKKRPYIVMEYFAGVTLRAYVEKNGELAPEKYATVARQIVGGMTAAHRQGVVHRHLKPDNILIDDKLGVKIIDFGFALRRQIFETSAKQVRAPTVLACSAVSTLAYAAPEQMGRLNGVKEGMYSDVFGFGKTSWFALFNVESPASPSSRHRAKISPELVQILEKCSEYHPKDRYPDFGPVWKHFNGDEDDASRKKRQDQGETKLVEVLRDLFDNSGGEISNVDLTAATAVCRQYGISAARSQEIIQTSWEQWLKLHPPEYSAADIALRKQQERDTIHARALKLKAIGHLAEAVEELEKLPTDFRDRDLYASLCLERDEATALTNEIADAVRKDQLSWSHRAKVCRLKELHPFRIDLNDLLERLPAEPPKTYTHSLAAQFDSEPPAMYYRGESAVISCPLCFKLYFPRLS